MAKISIRSIYHQSNLLKEQIPLFPFMQRKERTLFVKEVKALIDAAKQAEQITKSQQAKSRLQNIIEVWEEFLSDIKYIPVRFSSVISRVAKTSPSLIGAAATTDFTGGYSSPKLVSRVMSSSKTDPNSPVTIPLDPKLRAIYDELSGTIDEKG